MDLAAETVVTRNVGVLAERIGDETVILDPEVDRYFRLNATGTRLWEHLDRPVSVAQLVEHAAITFGVEPHRAAADVTAFVRELDARGLLVLSP